MKPARIIVLVIAVVAGGIAALLAGRSDPPPPPAPAPIVQLETTDVLIANSDIGLGTAISERELCWQTWPTAAAGPSFIRKSDRPDAIRDLAGAIARVPFSAGEPIRESKLIKANGSGYMAAILPSDRPTNPTACRLCQKASARDKCYQFFTASGCCRGNACGVPNNNRPFRVRLKCPITDP